MVRWDRLDSNFFSFFSVGGQATLVICFGFHYSSRDGAGLSGGGGSASSRPFFPGERKGAGDLVLLTKHPCPFS